MIKAVIFVLWQQLFGLTNLINSNLSRHIASSAVPQLEILSWMSRILHLQLQKISVQLTTTKTKWHATAVWFPLACPLIVIERWRGPYCVFLCNFSSSSVSKHTSSSSSHRNPRVASTFFSNFLQAFISCNSFMVKASLKMYKTYSYAPLQYFLSPHFLQWSWFVVTWWK